MFAHFVTTGSTELGRLIKELTGKQDSLRTQLTEVHKRLTRISVGPETEKKIEQFRSEFASTVAQFNAIKAELNALQESSRGMANLTMEITSVRQELSSFRNEFQALSDLKPQTAALKLEVQQTRAEVAAVREIRQQLGALSTVASDVTSLKTQSFSNAQQISALSAAVAEAKSLKEQSISNAQQLQVMAREVQVAKQDSSAAKAGLDSLADVRGAHAAAMQRMDKAFQELQNGLSIAQETKQKQAELARETKQKQAELARGLEQHSSESKALGRRLEKECQKLGDDIANTRQRLEKSLREVIANDVGRDLSKVRSDANVTAGEFRSLKQELFDSGILKPKQPELQDSNPVGTVELGETCFSARLLIRLSYMMARAEAKAEERQAEAEARGFVLAEADESDEDRTSVSRLEIDMDSDVHGLQPPTIAENGRGYMMATYGFGGIVWLTVFLQLLIVVILVWYSQVPTECWDATPNLLDWSVLHVSKAAAVFVAGTLMCKDLMEICNQLMVSVLLQGGFDCENVLSTLLRALVIALIAFANVFLFRGMVSAVNVWVNMAALAFVGELGGGVLEAAKRGVFGHTIRAVTTPITYELTFMSEYPWWIPAVQQATMLVMAIGTIASAAFVFLDNDAMCSESA